MHIGALNTIFMNTNLNELDSEIRRIIAEKLYEIVHSEKYNDEEKEKMMKEIKKEITSSQCKLV